MTLSVKIPANDDTLSVGILEQAGRVASAFADAEKANVFCQSNDFERCWEMVEVEKIELRRLLINAGIDWRAFERSFS